MMKSRIGILTETMSINDGGSSFVTVKVPRL